MVGGSCCLVGGWTDALIRIISNQLAVSYHLQLVLAQQRNVFPELVSHLPANAER